MFRLQTSQLEQHAEGGLVAFGDAVLHVFHVSSDRVRSAYPCFCLFLSLFQYHLVKLWFNLL